MLPSTSLLGIYLFGFSLAIGAVLSPGPLTTAILSQSPRTGWETGPLISVVHALLELGMVLLIALGLSELLSQPGPQVAVALLGGLLLLWMGGGFVLQAIKKKYTMPQADQEIGALDRAQIIRLGVFSTISNPFWYAWWMTVAAAYILQAKAIGMMPVFAFFLGHVSADFLWNTTLSTVIASGRRVLTDMAYNIIMGACGLFLVYLGAQFFLYGWALIPT
jgi:threonine/homoserine/homoserine lactone efflux protein